MAIIASQLVGLVTITGAEESAAKLEGVGAASENAGKKLALLAVGGAVIAGGALVALGVKAAMMAGDFQVQMLKLYTTAGESFKNLTMVGNGILNMAPQVGTSVKAQGMMTFQQLATSLANVLPASAKFHISLQDVTAAMATMTAQGDPAAQAATHLKQMILALEAPSKIGAAALKLVGLTSQQIATEMTTSLPDALKMITDAVGKKFPAGSAAYNQAIKDIAGGNKQMMGFLELTGTHLQTFNDNVAKIAGTVKTAGNSILGWSDIQKNFNFQLDSAKASLEAFGIKIGTSLLPYVSQFINFLSDKGMPLLSRLSDWVVQTALPAFLKFSNWLTNQAIPYLQGLAKTVAGAGWCKAASSLLPWTRYRACLGPWLAGYRISLPGCATAIHTSRPSRACLPPLAPLSV